MAADTSGDAGTLIGADCRPDAAMEAASGFPAYMWPGCLDEAAAWRTARDISAACGAIGGTLWRAAPLGDGRLRLPFAICAPYRCGAPADLARHILSRESALVGGAGDKIPIAMEELSDWRALRLDVVIPGIAKAGTTWLARQLSQHGVEFRGFAFDGYGEEFPLDAEEGAFWPSKRHVHRWNRVHVRNSSLVGAKQPRYLQTAWFAQVLAHMGAKVVIVARSPVDLCHSLYLEAFRSPHHIGPRPTIRECILQRSCGARFREHDVSGGLRERTQTFSVLKCTEVFAIRCLRESIERHLLPELVYVMHTHQLESGFDRLAAWLGLRGPWSLLQRENAAKQHYVNEPEFLEENDLCSIANHDALLHLRHMFEIDEGAVGSWLSDPLPGHMLGDSCRKVASTAQGSTRMPGTSNQSAIGRCCS